jgi:hypothetical protein
MTYRSGHRDSGKDWVERKREEKATNLSRLKVVNLTRPVELKVNV